MTKTVLYVLLCVISWAFIPVASKEVLKDMNNFAMLFFSNLISTVILLLYLTLTKKVTILKKFNTKDYAILFFLGFLGSFAFYILLYKAFSISLAQEVFIINYTWPILIVLFSALIFREKLNSIKFASILISFIGVVIILTKGRLLDIRFTNIEGDLLALSASVCFALFSVLGKKVKYDQIVAVFVYFLSATVFCLSTLKLFVITHLSINSLFWLLINGMFINGISYIFWFKALKSAQTALVSNLIYLTPAVSLIFIALILKEKIHLYSLFGLIFILTGIGIQLSTKPI